ncbi:MAG: hypothetical protein ACPLSY_03660 [Moorellaceae bacterium]
MYFDDVYGILEGVFMLQKIALALPVILLVLALGRTLLWALLIPVCGQQAGLVANVLVFCGAFLLLAGGHGMDAIEWAAGMAGRLASGLGLPYFGGDTLATVRGLIDQAVWQLRGLF